MDLARGRDVLQRYHDAVLMGVARKGVFRNEGFLTPDDFSVRVKTIGSETPVDGSTTQSNEPPTDEDSVDRRDESNVFFI